MDPPAALLGLAQDMQPVRERDARLNASTECSGQQVRVTLLRSMLFIVRTLNNINNALDYCAVWRCITQSRKSPAKITCIGRSSNSDNQDDQDDQDDQTRHVHSASIKGLWITV